MSGPRFLADIAGGWGKSSDFATWVVRGTAAPTPFATFATNGRGQWVSGSYSSDDGVTWTSRDSYLNPAQIIWTGTQFVAAGRWADSGGTPFIVATSPNGKRWTYRATPIDATSKRAVGVAANGATLVIVGYDTTSLLAPAPFILRSTDNGVTWTAESFPALPDPANGVDTASRWACVAYTDRWYAGAAGTSDLDFSYGRTFYQSTDAITWTLVTGSKFFSVRQITAHGSTQLASVIHHSEDLAPAVSPNYTVANPPFAAAVVSPKLAVSTDGWASMTPVVTPFDHEWEDVAGQAEVTKHGSMLLRWVHDRWVMLGLSNQDNQAGGAWTNPDDYSVATSLDGITWTIDSDPLTVTPNAMSAVDYGPFGMARLRQSPRDDFLGHAPRQGVGSTSRQASTRQGWRNAYR